MRDSGSDGSTRQWRVLAAVATVMALIATLLAVVVADRAARIDDQLRHSNAILIAQQSNAAAEVRPDIALQLALAAYREKPDSPEAYGTLLQQRLYWRGIDRIYPEAGEINELQSSVDGSVVLTVSKDANKNVTVWEGLTTSQPKRRDIPARPSNVLGLSPDGRLLAEADGPVIKLWPLGGQSRSSILRGPDAPSVEGMGFSPNGRFLAVRPVAESGPLPVEVWDTHSGKQLGSRVLTGSGTSVTLAHPSDDCTELVLQEASESGQRTLVRETATGAERRSFGDDEILGSGSAVVACADGLVTVRDAATGSVRGQRSGIRCPARWDISGQYLLLTESGRDAENYTQAVHWPSWRSYAFTNSAQQRALGASPLLTSGSDRSLNSLMVTDGSLRSSHLDTASSPQGNSPFPPEVTDLSPKKRRWVTYTDAGELALLDSEGKITRRVPMRERVDAVSFDPTGLHVLVVSDGKLRFYNGTNLAFEHEKELPAADGDSEITASVSILPIAPDEVLVAYAGRLTYWNPRTGAQTSEPLRIGTEDAGSATLRPHRTQVVVQQGDGLSLWDFVRRERIRQFRVDISNSTEPVVDTGGSVAAVSSDDGEEIALFDLEHLVRLPAIDVRASTIHGIAGRYLFLETSLAFQVWDWKERKLVTNLALEDGYREGRREIGVDRLIMDSTPGRSESVPLEAENWYRSLCRLSDREFTSEEIPLLPAGVSRERPCADVL